MGFRTVGMLLLMTMATPAVAAVEFPEWDFSSTCSTSGGLGGQNFTKNCTMMQDASKYMARKHWGKMSDADRQECIGRGLYRKSFPDYRGLAGCMQRKVCGSQGKGMEAIMKGPKECAEWQ